MLVGLVTGKEQLELVEMPEPTPHEGTAVVEITYCGICGTDIHAYQSGDSYRPTICGHEWVGTVAATGTGVTNVSEGDRVVGGIAGPCGHCVQCRSGMADRCLTAFTDAVGAGQRQSPHGAFASAVEYPADRCLPANASLSDTQAAQVEPATVAFHAVRRSSLSLGDVAVVQGAGPIGLLTMQFVVAAGAGHTIVVEPNPARAQLALDLGATEVVAPGDAATETIRERTKGLGADAVYECAGVARLIQTAVDFARPGGAVMLVGVPVDQATINASSWLRKEINLDASLAYTYEEFERCMGFIADGRVKVDQLHDTTVPLGGLGDALADLASGTSAKTKVLVDPNA